MAIPFLNSIDLNQNQALNMRLHQLATAPSGVSGQVYYNTATNRPAWYDGTVWQDIYPSTNLNTFNTDVRRDGAGNFTAGTITAALSGNASTATQLQNSQNFSITGKATASAVGFNGTGAVALNITTLTVAPGDIALANGSFIVGNASNVGVATLKSSIPLNGFGAAAGDVSMGGFALTNLAPTTASDNDNYAATKGYVDAVASGLDIRESCRLATAGPLPTNTRSGNVITATGLGALTVDGVPVVVGNRILVKDEATAANNGIYTVTNTGVASVAAFVLTRATDFDTTPAAEVTSGAFTFIEEGAVNSDTGWVLTTNNPITINSTGLVWTQFSGSGSVVAGYGVARSGNTINFYSNAGWATGDLFYGASATNLGVVAAGGANKVLLSSSGAPTWGQIPLTTHVTGTLAVGNGGTGQTSLTANGVLIGNGTSAVTSITATAGQLLLGNASNVPTWTSITGDVTISGTGVTTLRSGVATSVIGRSANTTGAVADIAASADKQFLRRAGGVLGFGSLIFSGTLGAGTQASFTVTHNLGTQDCIVFVYQAASPFAQVFTDVEMATANTVTVRFAAAVLGTNYRAVVVGF
jgi:hypothetical protein